MDKLIFSKYSNERAENLKIRTDIYQMDNGERYIEKIPCSKESKQHISKLYDFYNVSMDMFQNTPFVPNKCVKTEDGVRFEYLNGTSLDVVIDNLIGEGKLLEAKNKLFSFVEQVKNIYGKEDFEITPEFEQFFGNVDLPKGLKGSKYINIDLIAANVITNDEVMNVIDYEWVMEFLLPVNYLIYRIVFNFNWGNDLHQSVLGSDIYENLGITPEEITCYEAMEARFQSYTKGDNYSVTEWAVANTNNNVLDVEAVKYMCVQVYFDLGNGYSDDEMVSKNIVLNDAGSFDFEIKVPKNTIGIRLDPSESACLLKIDHFDMLVGDKKIKATFDANGKRVGTFYSFYEDDTQLYIMNYAKDVERIHFSGYLSPKVSKELIQNINQYSSKLENDNSVLEMDLNLSKRNVHERDLTIQYLNDLLTVNRNELSSVYASRSWRMTSGLRKMVAFVRKHRALYLLAKGIKVTLKQGPFVAGKKVHNYMKWRGVEFVKIEPPVIGRFNGILSESEEHFDEIIGLEKTEKKIAVHIHLYYEDLLGEFLGYLENIPYSFDVFISCQETADVKRIEKGMKKLSHVNKVTVMPMTNRGRDIAPLYVGFAKEIEKYDYFLHAHSKKSLYTGSERVGWRTYSLSSILGSEDIVRKIFELFERNDDIGLVYPDHHEDVPALAYSWLANEGLGRQFLNRINVPFRGGLFMYPAGSFFWARTDALRTMFDLNLTLEDFPVEAGQTDGTLAHVIERCTSLICQNLGYHDAILDYAEGVVRYDISYKPFRMFAGMEVENLVDTLLNFDVISFDIFDTLISRTLYNPDDIFKVMSHKIKEKYNLDLDFLTLRKKAEALANENYGVATNIYNIYEKMKQLVSLDESQILELQELEISLEHQYCIPRVDMLEVFNRLKEQDKRIILTSDMYLPTSVLKSILDKCGYMGYEHLYVSCDCGYRKDADTIWDYLFEQYPNERFIHVGDNPRSDWQTLVDRHKDTTWIMNGKDEFGISNLVLDKDVDVTDVNNSLALGTILNGGIFNSPFMLTRDGYPRFKDAKNFGFSVFGPLFYNFVCFVNQQTNQEDVLLFLAREGHILKQVYDIVFDENNPQRRESYYFLASRRSVTVAGISDWEDVRDILKKDYTGSLSNLLWSRLGVTLPENIKDEDIYIDVDQQEDVEKVMNILANFKGEIMGEFAKEKANYLGYVESLVPKEKWKDIVCVDVGYSGTIQYYMAKLLDEKISGTYLATFAQKKPELLGCKCVGMYSDLDDFGRRLQLTQLFLEAVLAAPFGQLIRFKEENGAIVPDYKKENVVSEPIKYLQEGILDYCRMRVQNNLSNEPQLPLDVPMMEKIYKNYLNGANMTEELADCFFVEDDYCKNGFLKFDRDDNIWKF